MVAVLEVGRGEKWFEEVKSGCCSSLVFAGEDCFLLFGAMPQVWPLFHLSFLSPFSALHHKDCFPHKLINNFGRQHLALFQHAETDQVLS